MNRVVYSGCVRHTDTGLESRNSDKKGRRERERGEEDNEKVRCGKECMCLEKEGHTSVLSPEGDSTAGCFGCSVAGSHLQSHSRTSGTDASSPFDSVNSNGDWYYSKNSKKNTVCAAGRAD